MSEGTLPFSETEYRKLDRAVFPTIRRRDKYGDVGDVNTVEHGPRGERDAIGRAEIVAKETVELRDLPDSFLCYDTETRVMGLDPREKAKDVLNEFYRNPIAPNEQLTLYWNRWVNKYE